MLLCEREFALIIHQEICVGCGRCQPYCPAGAISFVDLVSVVDQDKCYECGTCLRVEVCPVDVYEMENGKSVPVNAEECLGCESCIEVCDQEAITITET